MKYKGCIHDEIQDKEGQVHFFWRMSPYLYLYFSLKLFLYKHKDLYWGHMHILAYVENVCFLEN